MMGGGTTPKHVEQLPDINKLCNAASCWIYTGTFQQLLLNTSKHCENVVGSGHRKLWVY